MIYGNMINNENKDITLIKYNHLNLPTEIQFTNNRKINYTYDATGVKLKKEVNDGTYTTVTDYLDGYQYEEKNTNLGGRGYSHLLFFPHAEGYVKPVFSQNKTDQTLQYQYVYNHTDHLGNVRVSYSKVEGQIQILEENNYYPFGLKHNTYNKNEKKLVRKVESNAIKSVIPTVENPYNYKYNGKELQEEFDLNVYDYGARNYDPALGRFMNIDPIAEQYTNYSSYAYVANTPLIAIDPDGRAIIFIGGLRFNQGAKDQNWKSHYMFTKGHYPNIYRSDVFNYWSTDKNSFGKISNIAGMFKRAYRDDNAFYLSGSSTHRSQAKRRQVEGGEKAKLFHRTYGYGAKPMHRKIKDGETIKIVSHSQGGAHAAGFVSQLLTYKKENGDNLYNVEVIYYLNPHQPGAIDSPEGVKSIQYSVTSDQISGFGWMAFLGFNGGSKYAEIEGAEHNYLSVFSQSKGEGAWWGKRGGHNVNDGQKNILRVLNNFCKNNPSKCTEIKLIEK